MTEAGDHGRHTPVVVPLVLAEQNSRRGLALDCDHNGAPDAVDAGGYGRVKCKAPARRKGDRPSTSNGGRLHRMMPGPYGGRDRC